MTPPTPLTETLRPGSAEPPEDAEKRSIRSRARQQTSDYTTYLVVRPNVWDGVASILDVVGTRWPYNYSDSDDDADLRALWADWSAIGNDIRVAMRVFDQSNEAPHGSARVWVVGEGPSREHGRLGKGSVTIRVGDVIRKLVRAPVFWRRSLAH